MVKDLTRVAMDRSWVLSLVLLILFVSNASSFGRSRELAGEEEPKDNSNSTTTQVNSISFSLIHCLLLPLTLCRVLNNVF